jgi:hypothetical protein
MTKENFLKKEILSLPIRCIMTYFCNTDDIKAVKHPNINIAS